MHARKEYIPPRLMRRETLLRLDVPSLSFPITCLAGARYHTDYVPHVAQLTVFSFLTEPGEERKVSKDVAIPFYVQNMYDSSSSIKKCAPGTL